MEKNKILLIITGIVFIITLFNIVIVPYFYKNVSIYPTGTLNDYDVLAKPDLVQKLLEKGADPNSTFGRGATPLSLIAEAPILHDKPEGIESAKILLKYGADPNNKGKSTETPFFWAIYSNAIDIVKLFADSGAKIEAEYLVLAINMYSNGYIDMAEILISKGANVNGRLGNNKNILMEITQNRRMTLDTIKYLISKGADINAKDMKDNNILMYASRGNPDVLRFFLNKGFNVNYVNKYGQTALMFSAENPENTKLLLDKRAKVNTKDKDGKTALMFAAENPKTMKLLLDKGAKVNDKDKNGKTVLMYVIDIERSKDRYRQKNPPVYNSNFCESYKLLKKYEAKTDLKDEEGKTALEWAKTKGCL